MTTPTTHNAYNRELWASLTAFDRQWLRAEYKHLRLAGVCAIIANGTIRRTAQMFHMVKAGI
jgi:hypothetical protein